jgi:lysophospholipid acyltransferase (LPLAT)-like uncharacterized protein
MALPPQLRQLKNKYAFELIATLVTWFYKLEKIFYRSKCINFPKEKCVFAFWHAHQCAVFSCSQITPTCVMVSDSRDGEIVARAAQGVGLITARGSATRGGVKASLDMIKKIKEENVSGALMVYGPRGPNRVVKKGIIEIAKIAQVPIVPAVSWSPQKRYLKFKSWDEFRFPFLGTMLVVLFDDPIYVSEDATDEDIEKIRLRIENRLKEMYEDVKTNYWNYLKK